MLLHVYSLFPSHWPEFIFNLRLGQLYGGGRLGGVCIFVLPSYAFF